MHVPGAGTRLRPPAVICLICLFPELCHILPTVPSELPWGTERPELWMTGAQAGPPSLGGPSLPEAQGSGAQTCRPLSRARSWSHDITPSLVAAGTLLSSGTIPAGASAFEIWEKGQKESSRIREAPAAAGRHLATEGDAGGSPGLGGEGEEAEARPCHSPPGLREPPTEEPGALRRSLWRLG